MERTDADADDVDFRIRRSRLARWELAIIKTNAVFVRMRIAGPAPCSIMALCCPAGKLRAGASAAPPPPPPPPPPLGKRVRSPLARLLSAAVVIRHSVSLVLMAAAPPERAVWPLSPIDRPSICE